MLSRRLLRIKVLQALYAHFVSENDRIDNGEKQLFVSIDKLHDLFIYQLSLLAEITDFERQRMEEAKSKHLPTAEELNPNTRFTDNRFIAQIANNRDYKRQTELLKISWADDDELIRKLNNQIRESKEFEMYLSQEKDTYDADKNFIIKIFQKFICQSELLLSIYEEKSIYWANDFDTVTILIQKTIKDFRENWDEFKPLPAVFDSNGEGDTNDDRDFVKQLYRKTIIHSNEFDQIITQKADNWEYERIALMDIILLKMAMTELTEFPSIPIKVTLNEYIELSKSYSTPKSKVFINGVLDNLITDFKESKRIKKTGRGLME
jgi:transcription antitermination protein NusB